MRLVCVVYLLSFWFFFFSSRRRHTRWNCDWSSDVCSSDLDPADLTITPRDTTFVYGQPITGLHFNYVFNSGVIMNATDRTTVSGNVSSSHGTEIGRASCRERV